MTQLLAITKALSDASRVRALMALSGGELCVCQIMKLLELAPSTVSRHMAVLRQAKLVDFRKDGRWAYYRLSHTQDSVVRAATKWIRKALARDAQIAADARAVTAIKKISREELCAR